MPIKIQQANNSQRKFTEIVKPIQCKLHLNTVVYIEMPKPNPVAQLYHIIFKSLLLIHNISHKQFNL
ncbi:MAG: hypothetical protein IK134_08415 [Oscillospiraceae bacterium]|nr:hypothetical protein [Oscillospiraceae bacterium]